MNVRGYGGKISSGNTHKSVSRNDAIVLIIGMLIFVVSLGAIIEKSFLKFSVYILVCSIIALIISSIYVQFKS